MLLNRKFIVVVALVAITLLSVPTDATAGPLLDWIRGRRNQNACCPPQAAANPYNLQPGQCMKTCQQTCSRVVVNYVPYTAYRTCWKRVPVTTYKPVTNSDPCTGCTVTCMRPCTTYSYQMQRVPYTTYRPCYRTETYKVPVTTITNDCCSDPCNTCPTCPTGSPTAGCSTCTAGASVPNMAPTPAVGAPTSTVTGTYYEYPSSTTSPTGTITTEGGYNSSAQPADIAPSLNNVNPQSYNRPVLDQIRNGMQNQTTSRPAAYPQSAPQVHAFQEKTAQSPVRQEWKYSPIRLASYTTTDARRSSPTEAVQIKGTFKPVQTSSPGRGLNGWVEVD